MLNTRFCLHDNDGVRCAQVCVFNSDDLKYWESEAHRTKHLISFDISVPENWAGQINDPHDIYQIYPPELKEDVHLRSVEWLKKYGETIKRRDKSLYPLVKG